MDISKEEIITFVLDYIKTHNSFPSDKVLTAAGYSRAIIRTRFHSYNGMKHELINTGVVDNYISKAKFNGKYNEALHSFVNSKKRFIISSFICGTKVNQPLLKNLKALAKHYKAILLFIPTLDNKNKENKFYDPALDNYGIVTFDLKLNGNVSISSVSVSARSVDPSTGLPRLGQRTGSIIIGSTKQRLKYIPTGSNSVPHALMSTGTISLPQYSNNDLFQTKDSRIAEEDHKYGAIIVELEDDQYFHFRHIQAGPKNEVIDLGTMVKNGEVSKVVPEALVLGDWHAGKTDRKLSTYTKKLTQKLGISKWILHDIFDGDSINHHDDGKYITKAKKADNIHKLSLEEELKLLSSDIKWMRSFLKDVVIVKSNHDEFLDLYLNTGKYVQEPINHKISLKLALKLLEGCNPLESYIGNLTGVKWLKRDESYKLAGIECGMHGDLGANGARSSIQSLENAYKCAITGHSHTPQILRDMYVVGTSTDPFPDYGKGGPNSWLQTHCIVYPNGTRQLVNFINGKFTLLWA